jgi:hypothetical protein
MSVVATATCACLLSYAARLGVNVLAQPAQSINVAARIKHNRPLLLAQGPSLGRRVRHNRIVRFLWYRDDTT